MIFVKYESRLGNNIFQWAFARVLSKLSGVQMSALPIPLLPATEQGTCAPPFKCQYVLPQGASFIDVDEWVCKCRSGDVLVRGYPHNTFFFEPHRHWLVQELTPRTGDYVASGPDDVVIHIRWGDYFEPGTARFFGYPPAAMRNLLSSLQYDRCLIVTDTPGNELATDLVRHSRGTLVSGGVDHDYRTLYHASRFIMSPSTFSWWPAWSGQAREIFQPYEMGYWKSEHKFALDLSGSHIRRFDSSGRIL